jgi:D-sedoheptulose 7-phosphate isomerase
MSFSKTFLREASEIIGRLDVAKLERMAQMLADLRQRGGRLFLLGIGGSAANCSHAVNDFRKLASIEAYAPTDNVAELTARVNDEGWETVFAEWLRGSRLNEKDMLFVLSVGGGDREKNVSVGLIHGMDYARERGAGILAVVGRDGGYTSQVADVCLIVPTVNPQNVTPHAEVMQSVVWHLLVSHPLVKTASTKW